MKEVNKKWWNARKHQGFDLLASKDYSPHWEQLNQHLE